MPEDDRAAGSLHDRRVQLLVAAIAGIAALAGSGVGAVASYIGVRQQIQAGASLSADDALRADRRRLYGDYLRAAAELEERCSKVQQDMGMNVPTSKPDEVARTGPKFDEHHATVVVPQWMIGLRKGLTDLRDLSSSDEMLLVASPGVLDRMQVFNLAQRRYVDAIELHAQEQLVLSGYPGTRFNTFIVVSYAEFADAPIYADFTVARQELVRAMRESLGASLTD